MIKNYIYPRIITWYRIWYVNISWYVSNGHFGTWDKSFIFLDATWSHLETKHLTNSLQYMSCASYSLKCQMWFLCISSTFLWFSNTTFIYSFPFYWYRCVFISFVSKVGLISSRPFSKNIISPWTLKSSYSICCISNPVWQVFTLLEMTCRYFITLPFRCSFSFSEFRLMIGWLFTFP